MAEHVMRFSQIPEDHVSMYEELFSLKDEDFEQLIGAIRSAPKNVKVTAIASHISKKVKSIPAGKVKSLIFSLESLLGAMDMNHVAASQASKDVAQSAIKQSKNLKQADVKKYEKRVLELLTNPQLVLPSKAISLLLDHDRTFGSVRIISDIRPVFGEDATKLPHAWMLYHTLHVKCNLDKDVEEDIYIALDTADLRALKEAVKRASDKQEVLIKQLKQLKLDYVTPDEVEV